MVNVAAAIQSLWKDKCTIQTIVEYTKTNGAKGKRWESLVSDEPCKLSYFNSVRMSDISTDAAMSVSTFQEAKLFIRPDLIIPAGSRITVTLHINGHILYFENSGIPAYFTNHQEIILKAVKRWA